VLRVVIAALVLLGSSIAYPATDEGVRASLFQPANQALAAANEANAAVLSPTNYRKGTDAFKDAQKDFDRNGNLDAIRKKLADAVASFNKAVESSKLAEFTLTSAIGARDDASSADALKNAPQLWKDAEDEFARATTRLESGDVKRAKYYADKAEPIYREAELAAIKTSYLGEARALLAQADREKVERYAPITLADAQKLLEQAEHELNTNRYDTDQPRDLARQARFEARRALYIAGVAKQVKDKDLSVEQLILNGDAALNRLAVPLDVQPPYDAGFAAAAETIARQLEAVQQQAEDAKQLTLEVAQLREELGGTSKQVQLQEQRRQQIATTESYFTKDEARVLREGNDVILRLVGLNFASGKADIEPRNFALLRRVLNAIALFPGAMIEVQGHTDSYGSDAQNLQLSIQRADAVRAYLLANSSLAPEDVTAVGLGETRPIASNETPEGREKNRRIDVIIKPAG